MLRNIKTLLAVLVTAAACGAFLPGGAWAITQITNTATVNYNNEAAIAQTAVTGSTTYAAKSDPLLTVLKTREVGSGPSGTIETFVIKVTYPQISDVESICGDDSDADSVVVTDPIPAGFTFVGGSLALSTNNGTSSAYLTDETSGDDAGDYDLSNAGAITVSLGTLTEGTGDEAGCASGATARIVYFQAIKD